MILGHLSLCSGIGGLDLAAEWAGFTTVAQCEIDEYASKVLAKNFPGVPNLHDIRTVTNERLGELGISSDDITVISAGFPCQPYSLAGKGRGDCDERDLWGEVARVLGELRPPWFVGENTPGLFSRANQRYFRRILHDLTALGYRVGWGIWGACDVGAPHKRDRIFIMAHANGEGRRVIQEKQQDACERVGTMFNQTPLRAGCINGDIPDATFKRCNTNTVQYRELEEGCRQADCRGIQTRRRQSHGICGEVSYPRGERENEWWDGKLPNPQPIEMRGSNNRRRAALHVGGEWWQAEPDVGRVAHGVPARVDKLRCLGNAVVPAQAYPIFEAIAEYEQSNTEETL